MSLLAEPVGGQAQTAFSAMEIGHFCATQSWLLRPRHSGFESSFVPDFVPFVGGLCWDSRLDPMLLIQQRRPARAERVRTTGFSEARGSIEGVK
jgi:hypothetical protein